MKKILGLAIAGALMILAFPGNVAKVDAQSVAVGQPPMSTNPEIAALQAQTAILQKQLGILNQKLDQVLAKMQQPPAPQTSGAGPLPEPVAAPQPMQTFATAAPVVYYADTSGACAPAQTAVSLTAGACGSGAASAGSTSCGSGRRGLFPRWRARRAARGAGGCGG